MLEKSRFVSGILGMVMAMTGCQRSNESSLQGTASDDQKDKSSAPQSADVTDANACRQDVTADDIKKFEEAVTKPDGSYDFDKMKLGSDGCWYSVAGFDEGESCVELCKVCKVCHCFSPSDLLPPVHIPGLPGTVQPKTYDPDSDQVKRFATCMVMPSPEAATCLSMVMACSPAAAAAGVGYAVCVAASCGAAGATQGYRCARETGIAP